MSFGSLHSSWHLSFLWMFGNSNQIILIWLHLCMTELGLLLVAVLLVFHLKAQEKCQSKRSPPAVVCVGYQGRLGNLMFQYAFLYSVSRNRGLYPVVPENFQPSEPFRISKTTWQLLGVVKSTCENINSYTERWPCSFDKKLMDTPILLSAKFNGYFQSWKYWIQCENKLREIFKFQDKQSHSEPTNN